MREKRNKLGIGEASLSLVLDFNARFAGNDDRGGHVQEQSMLDDAFESGDFSASSEGIPNWSLEIQIHNVIGVIGNVGFTRFIQSQFGVASFFLKELLEAIQIVLPAELNHLHRHGEAAATEAVHELRVVDDDNELIGSGLHHLLAEEGTAAAFDKIEVGIDLVGAVDGEIEAGIVVEDREGDAEGAGLLLRALGGGDADDVGELAGGEERAELGDDEGGGGAGAEAKDHAALDGLDCLVGCESLEVVLGEGNGADGETMRTCAQFKRGRVAQDKARGGGVVHGGERRR